MTAAGWDSFVAEAMIQTDITGVLRQFAAFLPMLDGKVGATVMTTTSNLALVPRAIFPTYCATRAFSHSYLQSLRWQMRGTNIEIPELAPPYAATELSGKHQASDPRAIPLDAFVAEVMTCLKRADYPRGEVLVERYETVFTSMSPG